MDPIVQIACGFALTLITLAIHLLTVTASLGWIKQGIVRVQAKGTLPLKLTFVLTSALLLAFAIVVEAALWAVAFMASGTVDGFWPAVYFAIVTLTTLGYGDIVPTPDARLLAALCAIAGLFVVGLSTAFVVEILRRLEADEAMSRHS